MLQSMGLQRVRHDLATEQKLLNASGPGVFINWSSRLTPSPKEVVGDRPRKVRGVGVYQF